MKNKVKSFFSQKETVLSQFGNAQVVELKVIKNETLKKLANHFERTLRHSSE
jgi:hypothetical protein